MKQVITTVGHCPLVTEPNQISIKMDDFCGFFSATYEGGPVHLVCAIELKRAARASFYS